jgi:hypothetical protein
MERAAGDKMLGDIVAAQDADTAWYRKQFDLAATGPSPNPSLAGREGWLVGTGMETTILASQLPGQGRFDALAGRVFAEGMVGSARVGMSVTGGDIDIGTPAPDALIGMRPLLDHVGPTTGAGIIQPNLTARWEAPDWTTSTQLGTTPLNTAVAPLPTASLSVTHYMDPVIVSTRAFSQSVTNSLLSYGGMRDPVSGGAWGRVLDLGGSLQTIYLPFDRVSLSFTGEGAPISRARMSPATTASRFALTQLTISNPRTLIISGSARLSPLPITIATSISTPSARAAITARTPTRARAF